VLNADDQPSLDLARDAKGRRMFFALREPLEEGIVVAGDAIVRRSRTGDQALVPVPAVKLLGRHLLADVLAAAAVASIVGVDAAAMTRAVETFEGLEHALERVREIAGVRFVNDSKATNIESALRAIQSFDAGLVVILGGKFKGGNFADLRDVLVAKNAVVVAIGEATPMIRDAFRGAVRVLDAADMSAAVRTAFASAAPGHTVLLAPACASFDMFRDYAERGRVFKQNVARLAEEWKQTREH
jgi:UDP-N-acetylmuramoylalanine--D-glutamate ligase